MERATVSRRGKRKTPIEEIPAFRNHLEREGITAKEFHQRQQATDLTSEALTLSHRKNSLNKRK